MSNFPLAHSEPIKIAIFSKSDKKLLHLIDVDMSVYPTFISLVEHLIKDYSFSSAEHELYNLKLM